MIRSRFLLRPILLECGRPQYSTGYRKNRRAPRKDRAAISTAEIYRMRPGVRGEQRQTRSLLVVGGFYLHLVAFLQFVKVSRWKALVQHEIDAGHGNIKPDRENEFAHFSTAINREGKTGITVRKFKGNACDRAESRSSRPLQIGGVLRPLKVALIAGTSKMVIVKPTGHQYPSSDGY